MLQRLKLKGRILAGYSVPVISSILVATGVAYGVLEVKHQAQEVDLRSEVSTGMQHAAFKLAVNQRLTRGNILAGGKDKTRLTDFQENARSINQFIDQAADKIQDDSQKEKFSQIRRLVAQVLQLEGRLNEMVIEGKGEAAQAAVSGKTSSHSETRNFSKQLDVLIQEFQVRQDELLHESKERLGGTLQRLSILTIGAAIVLAGVAIAISWMIAAGIARSASQTVSQVDQASAAIAASVFEQEQAIAQQAAAVNQTTTTMEQLRASSYQMVEQAQAAAAGAQQTLELSSRGTTAIAQTMDGIQDLQERVRAISDRISHLSQQTSEISAISQLVADIASQTHILALNAAVEAARAGDQGEGFAVVAEQVRLLAEQSKQSAGKIKRVVQEIQTAITKTRSVTDAGSNTAMESLQLAEMTAEAFQNIARAIDSLSLNSQQIALANQQHSTGVQQVVSSMEVINQGARNTVNSATQIKSALQQLSEFVQKLKSQV